MIDIISKKFVVEGPMRERRLYHQQIELKGTRKRDDLVVSVLDGQCYDIYRLIPEDRNILFTHFFRDSYLGYAEIDLPSVCLKKGEIAHLGDSGEVNYYIEFWASEDE